MHNGDPKLFHRDIRWPNLIRLPNNSAKWILIDWDDASSPPTSAAKYLAQRSHAPEVFSDGHGGEVDIWAVGKLITDASHWILSMSMSIQSAAQWLQEIPRPTAEEALARIQPLCIN